jgi:transcriptional regulator with XRE-family HTH domain
MQIVRRLRRKRHLSQMALAVRAGVHVNTIRSMEAGASVSTETVAKVAKALGVPADRIAMQSNQQE